MTRAAPRHQTGAALLTAMVIVTLVTTLAAAMVWQQWRAVQVETAERSRMQSAWILSGALDWARLILREDAKSGRPTALTEPWATPLAETSVSTFLALDKDHTDDGPEAFLSGSITDAQARFNLFNLVEGDKVSPADLAVLTRLCDTLGVASDVPARLAATLRDVLAPPRDGGGNAPLKPQSMSQLEWLGLDADTVNRLAPHVVLLPRRTAVNLNTASREVIAAAVEGLDPGGADRLVQLRQRKPFLTLADAQSVVARVPLVPRHVGVQSSFFEVQGRLRLADRVLQERSLVERRGGNEMVVLQRERLNLNDAGN